MSLAKHIKKAVSAESDMLFWAIVFAVFNTLIYIIFIAAFGKVTVSGFTAAGGVLSFLAAEIIIILRENLRSAVMKFVRKSGHETFFGMVTALGFSAINLAVYFGAYHSTLSLRQVISAKALPFLAVSAMLTLMNFHSNALPCILFSTVTESVGLLFPLKSAVNSRMSAFAQVVLCMMFIIVLDCAFSKKGKKEKVKERHGGRAVYIGICSFALVLTAAFFVGVLPVKPVSIASGSMQPLYSVGDMVIVKKGNDNIAVGDIIQFRRDSHTVVHRVAEVSEKDGEVCYITKGDANNANDSGEVTAEEIIGKVVAKIPYAGRLTLWLHGNDE